MCISSAAAQGIMHDAQFSAAIGFSAYTDDGYSQVFLRLKRAAYAVRFLYLYLGISSPTPDKGLSPLTPHRFARFNLRWRSFWGHAFLGISSPPPDKGLSPLTPHRFARFKLR